MESVVWQGNRVIGQKFGCTDYYAEPVDPNCPGGHRHFGIDVELGHGDELYAVEDGAIEAMGLGYLWLRTSPTERWGYFHGFNYLVAGKTVGMGDLIGNADNVSNPDAGIISNGDHLHLQYEVNGVPTDPVPFLEAQMSTLTDIKAILIETRVEVSALAGLLAPNYDPNNPGPAQQHANNIRDAVAAERQRVDAEIAAHGATPDLTAVKAQLDTISLQVAAIAKHVGVGTP